LVTIPLRRRAWWKAEIGRSCVDGLQCRLVLVGLLVIELADAMLADRADLDRCDRRDVEQGEFAAEGVRREP
jgi:hypothetical protein